LRNEIAGPLVHAGSVIAGNAARIVSPDTSAAIQPQILSAFARAHPKARDRISYNRHTRILVNP